MRSFWQRRKERRLGRLWQQAYNLFVYGGRR